MTSIICQQEMGALSFVGLSVTFEILCTLNEMLEGNCQTVCSTIDVSVQGFF